MQRYYYKFVWKDTGGLYQTAYLDSSSLDAAKEEFEAEYKLNVESDKVKIQRVPN